MLSSHLTWLNLTGQWAVIVLPWLIFHLWHALSNINRIIWSWETLRDTALGHTCDLSLSICNRPIADCEPSFCLRFQIIRQSLVLMKVLAIGQGHIFVQNVKEESSFYSALVVGKCFKMTLVGSNLAKSYMGPSITARERNARRCQMPFLSLWLDNFPRFLLYSIRNCFNLLEALQNSTTEGISVSSVFRNLHSFQMLVVPIKWMKHIWFHLVWKTIFITQCKIIICRAQSLSCDF